MSIEIRGKWIIIYDSSEHRLLRDDVVMTKGNRINYVGRNCYSAFEKWINECRMSSLSAS